MNTLELVMIVLYIHEFSAIFFIGGSFFIWLIVWPASYKYTNDETQRTRVVGLIGRLFGYYTHALIITLLATGAYLGYEYIGGNFSLLTTTLGGKILLAKVIVVIVMIVLMYVNNIYHGKLIMRLSEERKYDQMKKIRRITHIASFITLGLMVVIMVLAVSLQFYMP